MLCSHVESKTESRSNRLAAILKRDKWQHVMFLLWNERKSAVWLEAVKPGFYMWNKVQLLRQSELSVDHWLASVCVSAAIYIHELSRYSGMRLLLWEPWEVRGQTAAEVKTVQVETGSSKTWSADWLRGCCGNRVLRADWLLGLIRTGGRISPRRKNVWSHQNFQSKTGKVSS